MCMSCIIDHYGLYTVPTLETSLLVLSLGKPLKIAAETLPNQWSDNVHGQVYIASIYAYNYKLHDNYICAFRCLNLGNLASRVGPTPNTVV